MHVLTEILRTNDVEPNTMLIVLDNMFGVNREDPNPDKEAVAKVDTIIAEGGANPIFEVAVDAIEKANGYTIDVYTKILQITNGSVRDSDLAAIYKEVRRRNQGDYQCLLYTIVPEEDLYAHINGGDELEKYTCRSILDVMLTAAAKRVRFEVGGENGKLLMPGFSDTTDELDIIHKSAIIQATGAGTKRNLCENADVSTGIVYPIDNSTNPIDIEHIAASSVLTYMPV